MRVWCTMGKGEFLWVWCSKGERSFRRFDAPREKGSFLQVWCAKGKEEFLGIWHDGDFFCGYVHHGEKGVSAWLLHHAGEESFCEFGASGGGGSFSGFGAPRGDGSFCGFGAPRER